MGGGSDGFRPAGDNAARGSSVELPAGATEMSHRSAADQLKLQPDVGPAAARSRSQAAGPRFQDTKWATYLMINSVHAWQAITAHLQGAAWPEVTDRVNLHERPFVEHLVNALRSELIDFKADALAFALSPHDLYAELEPMRPDNAIVWTPAIGERLAQMFHLGVARSLERLLPSFVRAVDARASEAAHGEVEVAAKDLALSHPIDRFVARALAARVDPGAKLQVAEVVPDATQKVTKEKPLRLIALRWAGTPDRWNVLEAINFRDATPREVAASMFKQFANDFGGDATAFLASELIAVGAYFIVRPATARRFAAVRQWAPMLAPGAVDDEQPIDTMVSRVGTGRGSDTMAVREASETQSKSPAPALSVEELRGTFDDVLVQLAFCRKVLTPWGLGGSIAPTTIDTVRRRDELVEGPADQRATWGPIVVGQRDRLFRIATSAHGLSTKGGMGQARDSGHPLHPILSQLAAAVASSHLASTCEARIAAAEQMQASLSLQSLQANLVDLEMARDQAHPGQRDVDKDTAAIGSSAERVRSEGRALQNRMIAGGEVDATEVERVQIEAQEQSLRYRVHGLRVQIGILQMQAAAAKKGFAKRIAGLFSGKFRDLPGVAAFLVAALGGVEIELEANYQAQAFKPRAGDADGLTPASPATQAKKYAVTRAQSKFAQLSEDHDLQHFLSQGAALVEAQQLRTACVQAAMMIGINLASSGLGGWVAKKVGERFLAAKAVGTVAELSKGAQAAIKVAGVGAEIAGNTLGQYATTDDGLVKSLVDNTLLTVGTNATLGRISRDIEKGRAFRKLLDKQVKAIEGVEARVAAQSARLAKVASWSAVQTIEITGHTVTGMAMGAVVHKLEEQIGLVKAQPQMGGSTMQDLLIQGASMAIAKLSHAKLGERMPSLARLATDRESARAQKLHTDALELLAISRAVATSPHPDAVQALEILDRQRQLLADEIAVIDEMILRRGATHEEHGDLATGRAELEAQLGRVNDAGMLQLRFQLVGMHSLGGPVWSGTREQIDRAKLQIKTADPKAKLSTDSASGTVTAVVGGQTFELHEVAGHGRAPVEVPKSAPKPKATVGTTDPTPTTESGVATTGAKPTAEDAPYATTTTVLSNEQRSVVDGTTPKPGKPKSASEKPRLDEFESHSFQTAEQQDASRWQDHGIDSFADEAVRDPAHATAEEKSALALRNDPEFRLWYGKWKSMPDRVVVQDDGSYTARLPAGIPEHVAAKLRDVIPKTNILLTTRAIAIREQIVRELPNAVLDPMDPQWPATRKRLVEMYGEARVAKYEQERTTREGDAGREGIDKRIHEVVAQSSIDQLSVMFPGVEIYITGAASQPEKEGRSTSDVDIVAVVPEGTPQRARAEMEERLNSLTLQQAPSKKLGRPTGPPLPIDGKVMTPSEFAGMALIATPAGRTPLNYARVDTTPTSIPGMGASGGDLHTHMMGVTPASYFVDKIGGGNAAVALEKAWEAVQNPKFRDRAKPTDLPVSKDLARQLIEGLTDVRRARDAGMPAQVIETRARRALDDVLEATERTPFDHTYDLRDLLIQAYIDPSGSFENYATDVITAEHDRGVTRSEQSVSMGKLQKRFTPEAMAKAHARAGERDVDLKFLVMAPTDKTLASEKPESVEAALRAQLARPDVKGIDIAGPERKRFTPAGLAWFRRQIAIAREAARAKGDTIVVRPHVGEGYKTDDSGEHAKVAHDNLEQMIAALEEDGYHAGDGVIVRFGHAAHADASQLARMAKMGIIVEANIGSNLATGSIATAETHPLLLNMYFGVSTVLSTDGAGVMRTNLPLEYQRAAAMIEQFRTGRLVLDIGGGVKKTFQDLNMQQKARFSVQWLTDQLASYYERADAPVPKGS